MPPYTPLHVHLCTVERVCPCDKFLAVELLGQRLCAFYILVGVAQMPCKKFAPIYSPVNVV